MKKWILNVSWGSFGHSTISQSKKRIHDIVPHNFAVLLESLRSLSLIFFNFPRFDKIFLGFSFSSLSSSSVILTLLSVWHSAISQVFFFVLQKLAKNLSKSAFINKNKNFVMAKIDKTSNIRLRKLFKRCARCVGLRAVDIKTKQELIKKVHQILF